MTIKTLGQVALIGKQGDDLIWDDLHPAVRAMYERMAAAVEAEVLRRLREKEGEQK